MHVSFSNGAVLSVPSRLDIGEPVTGLLPGEKVSEIKGPKEHQRTMTLAERSAGVALLAEHLRLLSRGMATPLAEGHPS